MKNFLHFSFFLFFTLHSLQAQLVITEIYFNSLGVNDSDYLEIYNNSGTDLDLQSYRFTDGIEHVFPSMILKNGEYLVLTVDSESLKESLDIDAIQWDSGTLGNADQIRLVDPMGNLVDQVSYDPFSNPNWPPFAAGTGLGYQLCDVNSDNTNPTNWQITNESLIETSGQVIYGTPGWENTCAEGPVVLPLRKELNILETENLKELYFYLDNSNFAPSKLSVSVDPSSTASPDDYNILNNEAEFNGTDHTSATFTIQIINDNIEEDQEYLILNIEVEDNISALLIEQVTLTIYDDDTALEKGMVLVGIFDADDTDDIEDQGVELFAIKDVDDLSRYSIGIANNGGGTDGIELNLPAISLKKGENYFISDSKLRFEHFFGIESNLANHNVLFNGDDAIELFENGKVIDVFGEIDVDGTGSIWEYTNGWAKRISNTGPNMAEFDPNNWLFGGTNILSGVTNDQCAIPYPFDIYTSILEANENVEFSISPTLTTGRLIVNHSDLKGKAIIFDQLGEVVSYFDLNRTSKKTEIDVENLASGIYFLALQGNDNITTRKFIKI